MMNQKSSGRYSIEERIERLIEAFEKDNFIVDREEGIFIYDGGGGKRIGLRALSRTATNYETGEAKRAYYVEGEPYELGYLMGLMAEPEIARMTTEYIERLPLAFLPDLKLEWVKELISGIINEVAERWSESIKPDIPEEFHEEMEGVVDGCRAANPETKVTLDDLWVLNVGFDAILARVYTGEFFDTRLVHFSHIKLPLFCNAFSLSGEIVGGEHYFGRDFMFFDVGVFQDVAALTIYNPLGREDGGLPLVSMSAPGMVGSVLAMNTELVAMGLNVSPSEACRPARPGFNSLLLTRYAVAHASSAEEVVEIIAEAQRGVSWNYPVVDGKTGRSVFVEAIQSLDFDDEDELIDYLLSFPPEEYTLPGRDFLKEQFRRYEASSHQYLKYLKKGIFPRWDDYEYEEDYLAFNPTLWEEYNHFPLYFHKVKLYEDAFEPWGFINRTYEEHNCPNMFYFAPQREESSDVGLATNHFIGPEIRLTVMGLWINLISGADVVNDFQWRYDALNALIRQAIEEYRTKKTPISYEKAKEIVNFLNPKGEFPHYYDKSPSSSDGKTKRVEGSVNILDLKKNSIESLYGYYADEWVKIVLKRYIF